MDMKDFTFEEIQAARKVLFESISRVHKDCPIECKHKQLGFLISASLVETEWIINKVYQVINGLIVGGVSQAMAELSMPLAYMLVVGIYMGREGMVPDEWLKLVSDYKVEVGEEIDHGNGTVH
jgi:hypothetical protein